MWVGTQILNEFVENINKILGIFIESKTLDKTASCLLYFELSVDRQEVWKERKA